MTHPFLSTFISQLQNNFNKKYSNYCHRSTATRWTLVSWTSLGSRTWRGRPTLWSSSASTPPTSRWTTISSRWSKVAKNIFLVFFVFAVGLGARLFNLFLFHFLDRLSSAGRGRSTRRRAFRYENRALNWPKKSKKYIYFFSFVSQVAAVDGEDSALLAGRQVLDLASRLKSKQLPKLKAKKPHKTNYF